MKSSVFLPSLGLLALQPSLARAYWRMACSVSQTSRTDPILSPGTVSGHVHKFAGGDNVDPSSTHDSLLTSTCSSCEVQEDKSAYWTPQLYYSHSNGTVEEVQNDGMTVYYVGRGGDSLNTVAFPPGFKMISGNSLVRSYDTQSLTYLDTRPIADRVSFRCINEANNIPEQHYMFDTNCVNGMRAQINFQSCWDGQNLYLPGSEHVAYLSGIDYGECPSSHPIPIPGLFFEVLYWTNRVDQSKGGQFVFANGDTTGYGFHGDFLNGWNQDVQTQAVQDCLYTDNGGVVSACPVLASSDDVNFSRNCAQSPSVWDEPVHGSLSSLPGCNPLTSGPAEVPQVVCPVNSNTPLATQSEPGIPPTTTSTVSTLLATNSTTSTDAPFQTPGFDSISISTFTFSGPFSQATGGIFATVSTNSIAVPTSTYTNSTMMSTLLSSPTPMLSFTTIYVTATATVTQAPLTFTPATSFLSGTDACSIFSAFSIEGCPPPTSTVDTSSSTTSITSPTSTTAGMRRRRRRQESEASDLTRIIAEVAATKVDDTDEGDTEHGKDTSTDPAPQDQDQDKQDQDQDQDDDDGDATYHGSGMGCMLWGSCS